MVEKRYKTHPSFTCHDPSLTFVDTNEARNPEAGDWFITKHDHPGNAMLCTDEAEGGYINREILRRSKN